jgi:hypothetical protein
MAECGVVWYGYFFKTIRARRVVVDQGETRLGFIFKTKGLGSVWYGRVWHGYFFKNILAR